MQFQTDCLLCDLDFASRITKLIYYNNTSRHRVGLGLGGEAAGEGRCEHHVDHYTNHHSDPNLHSQHHNNHSSIRPASTTTSAKLYRPSNPRAGNYWDKYGVFDFGVGCGGVEDL